MDERLLEEADLGLHRVNVDVHAVGGHVDEQMYLRIPRLDARVTVRLVNGVGDRAVLDHPPVHKDVLRTA